VLLVDDNVDGAESLAVLLRMDRHEVRLAHDGASALEVAAAFEPQAVFLDVGLPNGMDGYELARRLRLLPGMGSAFLVALTGYGQEEDRRRSQEAGIQRHVVKPADPAVLRELLARHSV
jgi:CheY-like chemotaxis protein